MPTNGAAVLLPLELDPSLVKATANKPATAPAILSATAQPFDKCSGGIEATIGEATAAAAAAIGRAVADYAASGQLAPATKALGGESLARVTMLQLAHSGGDTDFAAVARREGRRVLHQRHDATFRAYGAHLDAATIDRVLGDFIDWVLVISNKVVADERARAN